jgi:protein translocase SecG subunit
MIVSILQVVVSLLLIIAILLQMPGKGLSPVFGGGGEAYRSKASAQKFLLVTTIALSSFLAIFSIVLLLLHK